LLFEKEEMIIKKLPYPRYNNRFTTWQIWVGGRRMRQIKLLKISELSAMLTYLRGDLSSVE
jgi:hypothetical protein